MGFFKKNKMISVDIKSQFPIFEHWPDLVYLDNAATTQKPAAVVEAVTRFYTQQNANVRRGIYPLAAEATAVYEQVREKVCRLLHAPNPSNIVLTSGATAGINLVAQTFLAERLAPGEVVLVTMMEHHANLIPWQQICLQKKARLIPVPVDLSGVLDLDFLQQVLVKEPVRMLAVTQVSNTLGTINPVKDIISTAHACGVPVLVDASQGVGVGRIDVQDWDVDFMVFSGHKIYGPSGTGVLYGKGKWLDEMPPWQFGGDMIREVTFERTVFAEAPYKFEAGTPNTAGVAGLGAAVDFLTTIDPVPAGAHARKLRAYALDALQTLPGFQAIGTAPEASGILSFILADIHPHDLATLLGQKNICVRAGQHCTQPLLDFYGIPATIRASFAVYNTEAEIDKMKNTLEEGLAWWR